MNEVAEDYMQRVAVLETAIREQLPPVELEVEHLFAEGTYTRVLYIPAGAVLTGKVHRHSCINIVSSGKIRVFSDGRTADIEAPHCFVSGAGVKKAGVALEDTVWVNVHPWNGVDTLEQIESKTIAVERGAIENTEVGSCLGQQ